MRALPYALEPVCARAHACARAMCARRAQAEATRSTAHHLCQSSAEGCSRMRASLYARRERGHLRSRAWVSAAMRETQIVHRVLRRPKGARREVELGHPRRAPALRQTGAEERGSVRGDAWRGKRKTGWVDGLAESDKADRVGGDRKGLCKGEASGRVERQTWAESGLSGFNVRRREGQTDGARAEAKKRRGEAEARGAQAGDDQQLRHGRTSACKLCCLTMQPISSFTFCASQAVLKRPPHFEVPALFL
eukprot:6044653-Pleurochrysis_carterae.AAC.1